MRYRVYGIVVECDEPVPELDELRVDAAAPVDVLVAHASRTMCDHTWATLASPLSGETSDWPVTLRGLGGYLLRFGAQAAFWVAASGREIRYWPSLVDRETRTHLLLDHVLPRSLYLLGLHPIHATAVARQGRVVAFVGKTGVGKSTLAAALQAHGCELVCDDCLVLRGAEHAIMAAPGYAGLRLYPDARDAVCPNAATGQLANYTAKQRVPAHLRLAPRALPLSAIYVLASTGLGVEGVSFAPFAPSESVVVLTSHAFHLDVERRAPLLRQLRLFGRIARAVPIKECQVPAGLSRLVDLGSRVLDDALGE